MSNSKAPLWAIPRTSSRTRSYTWLAIAACVLIVGWIVVVHQEQEPKNTNEANIDEKNKFLSWKNPLSWLSNAPVTNATSWSATDETGSPLSMLSPEKELKVVITENLGAHDEVIAPLIVAFGSLPGANISAILIAKQDRYGSFEMFRNLYLDASDDPEYPTNPLPAPRNYRSSSDFNVSLINNPPDILVAVTCTSDLIEKYDVLFEKSNVHIFCVVHHSDRWKDWNFYLEEKRWGKWVAADRLDFITLSPHVAREMPAQLMDWKELRNKNMLPPIHSFVPVFEVDIPRDGDTTEHLGEEETSEVGFALQGNYEATRRDFQHVFSELASLKKYLVATKPEFNSEIRLHLVGSGTPPEVPVEVQNLVVFDSGLNFTDFYITLSRMTGIIPAFADDAYFRTKASSSVPAALIAGVPLIATQEMLDAYSYLEEGAVWFQEEGQTEFNVVKSVMGKSAKEWQDKKRAVRDLRVRLIREAKHDVREWVEAMMRDRQDPENLLGESPKSFKISTD